VNLVVLEHLVYQLLSHYVLSVDWSGHCLQLLVVLPKPSLFQSRLHLLLHYLFHPLRGNVLYLEPDSGLELHPVLNLLVVSVGHLYFHVAGGLHRLVISNSFLNWNTDSQTRLVYFFVHSLIRHMFICHYRLVICVVFFNSHVFC